MDNTLYEDRKNFFSAWIFIFFILYYFNLSYFNPILLLIIALFMALLATVYIYLETNSIYHAITYFGINMFIKIVPIYMIINRPICFHDVIISVIMLSIYYVYATYYINFDIMEFYTQMPTKYLKTIIETFALH